MEQLDGKKIVNNIYSKSKESDVKIGDIEKDVPVSLGYFSRFLKDDNKSLPSLESLHVAANKLGVTIDFLLYADYANMNEEELLLMDKVSILLANTSNDKYLWKEVKMKDFYEPIYKSYDDNFYGRLPFVTLDSHFDNFGDVDYVIQNYYSKFLEENYDLNGSIFLLTIDSNDFYLSNIIDEEKKNSYYEFYVMIKDSNSAKLYKLVNASSKEKFYSILDVLYKTCVLKSQEFKLDSNAKGALNCIK